MLNNRFTRISILIFFLGFGINGKAQTLGSTAGNFLEINSMMGKSGNNFFNKSWLVRDAAGNDWTTARLHDGISVDVSFLTPMSNTKTWWERDPYHNIQSWGTEAETYLTLKNGMLGIGTADPTSRLSVQTPANGWIITSKAFSPDVNQINGIKLLSGYPNETNKWAGIASVSESEYSNLTGLALYAGQAERIRIASGGNVGIGTTKPTEKLAVNGNIRAKEIKVETANWPDYVFEENYRLPSLTYLETYIKANKHLPNIPDQKQVETEGISLGEMNRKLLEKVEELTLHLIEKEKEITSQHRDIENLKDSMRKLENLIMKNENQ